MATADVPDAYLAVYNELEAEFEAIDLTVYPYATDLIFKEFPCAALGFAGYIGETNYHYNQMPGGKGERIDFSIGVSLKSKDEAVWNGVSGIQALIYIIETVRGILRAMKSKRVNVEKMDMPIDSDIYFDATSQTYSYNFLVEVTVLRSD